MFVIQRNSSFWLCTTTQSAFVDAVQLRLQGKDKDFKVFEQRLNNGEIIDARVIKVYKCADATTCKDCTKYTGCEIRLKAIDTINAHNKWVKLIEANDGYTF
ncbi:hypothetical protein [Clostridium sp.]|uniref:hypothetical protein n=1 Tax=Clostridium sp. TaxID=1506 RepID=UPI002851B896|nr:hypothetical protein [Clostridium sp.]MDR3597092.1 hypothetical protein [Clostridium sp.]